MTHVQFAQRLVSEEKWLKFHTGGSAPVTKTELVRGDPSSTDKEDSWAALGRIAGDRGWRRFVTGANDVWYIPDAYILARPTAYTVEPGKDGVDDVDFDYDVGKPVAQLTITARAGLWKTPIAVPIQVQGCGVADGKWILTALEQSLFSTSVSITAQKPQPTLPEPKPDTVAGSATTSSSTGGSDPGTGATSGAPTATEFVNTALSQVGKPYAYGAEAAPSNPNPSSFDCSELVQWAANRVGLSSFPDGSGPQYAYCRQKGTLIDVSRAEHIKGALLFMGVAGSQHVAISLGDGRTVEARGTAYGTGEFSASGRNWSGAALVPGLRY
jgi:cell wall-associated NlpC family hydrolase